MGRQVFGIIALAVAAFGQAVDPAYASLEKAYEALRGNRYDEAVAAFGRAVALAPGRADVRKDLAYTLLKVGETEAARDQFAEAMRLNPADDHVALEYAFLCYETKQQVTARRVFDRVRKTGNQTAAQAYENIDRPLREGIARWKQALALSPDNFSAHEELARLAEQREELDLAAEQYERAWRLRPDRRGLLLDLGRVWKLQNRTEDANAALLAASRGAEPRVAEEARGLLPARYPYVYEFEKALALDPTNVDLRRELANLHVAMGDGDAADRQFRLLPESAPRFVQAAEPARAADPKEKADKSLEKGYLGDALKYLQAANANDPVDFDVMLKLGRTYNILKDDREAVRWFDLARHSSDQRIAAEASRAYDNLRPELRRIRTTVWAFPVISTRWRDAFGYAQAKAELRSGFPLHPYVSLRLIGDLRGAVRFAGTIGPQYLSERSVIIGAGVATTNWRGLGAWVEAGEAVRYLTAPGDTGRAVPDYRGGITYARAVRGPAKLFGETNDDGVFISRFGNDGLLYSQNRVGRTLKGSAQVYWNFNATVDAKGEYWGNTAETGPGVRFRFESVQVSLDLLRGAYLINRGNPYGPNFNDVRIGIWYAFSH